MSAEPRGPSGTGHDTARDPLVAFCKGGAATCEICVGSCGIEEYEATAPGPASVSPAEPPRRRITATHTRSLTFVQAEVDAVWNSGVLPIPHVELFWDEANDDVGYEITEDDPDA